MWMRCRRRGQIELPLDNIALLTAAAHKFGGPQGIGFLYARQPGQLRPLLGGGNQQGGLRPGTEPVALIVGLAAALQDACEHRAQNAAAKRALAADFCRTLRQGWPARPLPQHGPMACPAWSAWACPARTART